MSYIALDQIKLANSTQQDAFGRLRVSLPNTLFDSQQEYGLDLLRTWDATANGALPTIISPAGSVVSGSNAVGPRDVNTRLTPITVSTTNGHYSILQSKQYCRYIPGKSHLIYITGIFASGSGSTPRFVLRTSTSGSVSDANFLNQSSWNVDTFSNVGPNPSGITLDLTKIQILWIDAQMLYAGRIRAGFNINGIEYEAVNFYVANMQTLPTVQTYNLPIRCEIRNTGASTSKARFGYFEENNGVFLETERAVAGGTVHFECCSVQSEGGTEIRGFAQSASNGITTIPVTTRRPVLSVRPRAQYLGLTNRAHVELQDFILTASSNSSYYELVVGGTLTGASWVPVGEPLAAGTFVVGVRYVISSVGTTNFTLIGAASNTVGVAFTATGAGTGSGTAVREEAVTEYDVSATAIVGGSSIIKGFVSSGSGVSRNVSPSGDIDFRNPLVLSQIDGLAATQTPVSLVCTSFTGTSNISSAVNWHEQTI